eukprot:COSAG06_NODE_17925_length_914_cov_0.884663_2_plen_160_part_01
MRPLTRLLLLAATLPATAFGYSSGAHTCSPGHGSAYSSARGELQLSASSAEVGTDVTVTLSATVGSFKGFVVKTSDGALAGAGKAHSGCSGSAAARSHEDAGSKTSEAFTLTLPSEPGTVTLSGVVVVDRSNYYNLLSVTVQATAAVVNEDCEGSWSTCT